jgi:ABC-2 type transport system ATP-binding protein
VFLQVNHISKSYAYHQALNDVSFSIKRGTSYGLLGPNGAGKSTLIKIITRIINQDAGEILLDGQPLRKKDLVRIGYLPEERGLYKKMGLLEHLVYLGRLRGLTKQGATDRSIEWLERLSLADRAKKPIEDLSKGMQQKVQFIAAVLHDPEFIILDEPFSGFDPINTDQIRQEIKRLQGEGKTLLFSTHLMQSVEELCSELTLIYKSKNILSGTLSQIKETYKTGAYKLVTRDNISLDTRLKPLREHNTNEGITRIFQFKTLEDKATLLRSIPAEQLICFEEQIPSLDDIFKQEIERYA